MLTLVIPSIEMYDENKNEFAYVKGQELRLEHSLVSISKWESRWNKPFITSSNKTTEETVDYIKCMTITQNVNPEIYSRLSNEHINSINRYIEEPMTATIINSKGKPNREIITSEIIYYWMVALNIPFECQKWHLNRLLTLINVCSIKNQPDKKMSRREILNRNRELNAQRRKKLNTKG